MENHYERQKNIYIVCIYINSMFTYKSKHILLEKIKLIITFPRVSLYLIFTTASFIKFNI